MLSPTNRSNVLIIKITGKRQQIDTLKRLKHQTLIYFWGGSEAPPFP